MGPVPVSLHVGMLFEISAQIGVGFDTRGLRENHSFADGFYFKDYGRSGPPVFSIGAGVYANAAAGIPFVATVGIQGELTANLNGRWNNRDYDDKYHFDEMLDNLSVGPHCLINLGGSIEAQLYFYISALLYSATIPITPRITLFDFDIFSCAPLPLPTWRMSLPFLTRKWTLKTSRLRQARWFCTPTPSQLARTGHSDTGERFQVYQESPGMITVNAFGLTKKFGSAENPITSVYVDAGQGDNFITIDHTVTIPATIVGGTGNDKLRGGSGRNRIIGRGGRDTLIGGPDIDTIIIGIGEAEVYGGSGDDQITAQGGVNYIDGEDGIDTINGGPGKDMIYGGRGGDFIYGGGGSDQLFGDQDDDRIVGQGSQGCYIEGGKGNNYIIAAWEPTRFTRACQCIARCLRYKHGFCRSR